MTATHQLTICICVYNAEKYICQTLESLWNQTFKDFDLLLIDDCSSDSSFKLCQNFIQSHQWDSARLIHLPVNGGLAKGRHYAEQIVETEYLGFFDADDVALPQYVEKLLNKIQADPQCMAVGCYCEYISENSKKIGGGIYVGSKTQEEFFERATQKKLMFMSASSIIRVQDMKRAGGRNINGFPDGKPRYQDMCEDLDLWTRMSDFYEEGKYIIVIPEVLFQYRKMNTSMSSNNYAMLIRMRHIKTNLLRRRAGKPELTFIEFMASLTRWQKFKYGYENLTTGFYKKAGFYYMNHKYFRFLLYFGGCALTNPGYFLQKIRRNAVPALKEKRK